MNACDSMRADLVAYLDGALGDPARQALEQHLASCPACRAEIEALRAALEHVDALPPAEPSADMARRFWERFEREAGRGSAGWLGRWWRPRWALALGSSLALGLLVGLVVVLTSGPGRPPASQEDLVIAEHLDLFADYEAIEQLDLLEDLDVIESLGDEV